MIENLEYLAGYSTFKYPIKGPKGRPLTTADDVAVRILVDEDDDYAGYVSLSEVLTDLISVIKGNDNGEDTTEAIDSLTEVYNFLTQYNNQQVLEEIQDVTESDINNLFTEESDSNN